MEGHDVHHGSAVEAKPDSVLSPKQQEQHQYGGDGSSIADGAAGTSSDGAAAAFTCKTKGCATSVAAPDTACSLHGARPRRTRPASSRISHATSPPPPQAPTTRKSASSRSKAPLPQTLDALPTATIELTGDASAQKCSYHDCPNRAKVSQSYGIFCNRHAVVFPCGFPGCRDKAPTNGTRCPKHQEHGTTMLDEALAVRSQSIPVCRTKGCFKNDQGRGFCRGHEKLMMATGQLPHAINKRRLNSAYTMCCYPNCGKHSQRNHLCRIHGNDLIKQAQHLVDTKQTTQSFEDTLASLQRELRRCTHPDCDKNAQRDRLCTTHYHLRGQAEKGLDAKQLTSMALTDASMSKEKVLKFCSEAQCTQPVYCNWLCQPHYEQREKKSGHKQQLAKQPAAASQHIESAAKSSRVKTDYLTASASTTGMVDLLDHHHASSSVQQRDHHLYADALSLHDEYGKKLHEQPHHHHHHHAPSDQRHPSNPTSYWDPHLSSPAFPSTSRHQLHPSNPLATSGLTRYGYLEYNDAPSTVFFQDAAGFPPSRTTCANPTCSRQVLGKGLCEMCLGVPPHVHFPFASSSSATSAFDVKPPPSSTSSSDHFAWTPSTGSFHFNDATKPHASTHHFASTPSSSRTCNFDECQTVSKAPLCLVHANATLCVAPLCEEMVSVPGFCTDHALDNSCAVPGCHMAVLGSNPTTCVHHVAATRCSHSQCYKYATKTSNDVHCTVHDVGMMGVIDHCKLCEMYDMACPLVGSTTATNSSSRPNTSTLAKENTPHNSAAAPHFTTLSGHKLSL
ncbi:hypothetical protein DYB32_007485 [Aphanomyces invadans]|uniref:Uncharacterized protein n=1 Tax=Aphanomyces invadans TaxID=157072 RepID=A0A3R6ZLH5_9STRA|nr:hypothetical protein DYB32_007485 [Aphanomyces invadans]